MNPFFGKYRGQVTSNLDPLGLGRVQVSVPAVLGDGRLSWAMPCSPYAGDKVGFFAVPPIGANVWVEFEAGDTDFPILAGCFWGTGEAPSLLADVKIWKTESVSLTLSDLPGGGGVTLEVASPAVSLPLKLALTSDGIELSIGISTVKLTASSVSINNGALEVM
jgi:hypothetical protein